MTRSSRYRFDWWRLCFRHVLVDEGNRYWQETLSQKTVVNSLKGGPPVSPHFFTAASMKLREDVEAWLDDSRPMGNMGIERSYMIMPPREREYGTFDGPRMEIIPGEIRFARKADLMLFKMST